MLHHLSPYIGPITTALTLFPFIAAFFTLPFVIRHYRRYGGIALMRVMVVYSFILYCMCAYFLTILPLPSREAVAAMEPHQIGWIPFDDLLPALEKAGVLASPGRLSAWKKFLTCGDVFQYVANVVMTLPLGFYLRYYFRLNWKKTLGIALLTTLFFELTQLSALYGLYPQPYRYTEMDDIIANTLGAMLGFWLTPLLALPLPSREEIDRISYRKGERVTVMRRVFSTVLDLLLFFSAAFALLLFGLPESWKLRWVGLAEFTLYFGLLPRLLRGGTPGQALVKLRTVRLGGRSAGILRLLWRNFLLYGVELFALFLSCASMGATGIAVAAYDLNWVVRMLFCCAGLAIPVTCFLIVLRSIHQWNALPHARLSGTETVSVRKEENTPES